MKLTALEVALIAPLLGAAIAYAATRRTSQDLLAQQRAIAEGALHAQRLLERDKRLWEKKAAIYDEVLGLGRVVTNHLVACRGRWSQEAVRQLWDRLSPLTEKFTTIKAFASKEVDDIFDEYTQAAGDLNSAVGEFEAALTAEPTHDDPGQPTWIWQHSRAVEAAAEFVISLGFKLELAIRADLQSEIPS